MSTENQVTSFRRQKLYLEFASLRASCPEGLYLSISSADPTVWTGVLFVRVGAYAPAVLRLHIRFPDRYPELPPIIVFQNEIFHSLVVPLTTYTHSTADPDESLSISSEERLPPGGLSLRHGFPEWFESKRKKRVSAGSSTGSWSSNGDAGYHPEQLTLPAVLAYVKTVFEDESTLDDLPFEAAGNPSAWHARRAQRGLQSSSEATHDASSNSSMKPKRAAEWNWDGVWESRVKSGIDATLTEQRLYASRNIAADEVVSTCFPKLTN